MSEITKLNYNDLDDSYFPEFANVLLNECYLLVNKKSYRLVEIEFYLNCKAHKDVYTHGDPDQLLMHTFYFHKHKTGTYKSGTFKGLDLTFGSAHNKAYFGILIRSIQLISTGEIIEGPCNTVNRILQEYQMASIMDFTNGESLNILSNNRKFILKTSNKLAKKEIFAGPRIGLSNTYPTYQNKPYRFATDQDKLKKKKTSLISIKFY